MDYSKLKWGPLKTEARDRGIKIWKKTRSNLEAELQALDAGAPLEPEQDVNTTLPPLEETEALKSDDLPEEDEDVLDLDKEVNDTFDVLVQKLEEICGDLYGSIRDGGYRRKILDVKENAKVLLTEHGMVVILQHLKDCFRDGTEKAKVQYYLNELYDKPKPARNIGSGQKQEVRNNEAVDTEAKEVDSTVN